MSTSVKKNPNLKTQVYNYLKNQIMTGKLRPGERLIEEKISNDLEVSRSPIRESIRMLEKDGLLKVKKTGGVTVVKPTMEDFQHMYECRVEMEPLSSFYAAKRRSPEQLELMRAALLKGKNYSSDNSLASKKDNEVLSFHEAVVQASNNQWLISMVSHLRGINGFYRQSIIEENPFHVEQAFNEHQKIFQAIVDQDSESARNFMRQHIESDYNLFMELCRKKEVK
ncbi:GntR family transcriptional regulator [Psychrobacillus sp. FSL W7-1457]|uniref:GntR family transcriptional regulator n=1 Tax=unclassified Psychrobacillus TaxID=2636677 RepID=UPI0030F4D9B7